MHSSAGSQSARQEGLVARLPFPSPCPLADSATPVAAPCSRSPFACSGPTLVSVRAVGFESGIACVKPPALGGPWTAFKCQSCYKGSCKAAPLCSAVPNRRLLAPAPACQDSVACQLGSLESSTDYE